MSTDGQLALPDILGRIYPSVAAARAQGNANRYERHLIFLACLELRHAGDLPVSARKQEAVRELTRRIHLRHYPQETSYPGIAPRTWRRVRRVNNWLRQLRDLKPKTRKPADPALLVATRPALLAAIAGRDDVIRKVTEEKEELAMKLALSQTELFELRARMEAVKTATTAAVF